jgi:hypothetical protein
MKAKGDDGKGRPQNKQVRRAAEKAAAWAAEKVAAEELAAAKIAGQKLQRRQFRAAATIQAVARGVAARLHAVAYSEARAAEEALAQLEREQREEAEDAHSRVMAAKAVREKVGKLKLTQVRRLVRTGGGCRTRIGAMHRNVDLPATRPAVSLVFLHSTWLTQARCVVDRAGGH